ncbi:pyrimidine-specific ribonucleoside hydrolase [Nocardia sp. GAS34]|uniref:nucleoside hydrolase n=1 Tax=unclassified Nocardia TaxID=2637762 RepID=UPI003D262BD6
MPIILDTDIGGEPDDALALALAAGLPDLSLVITGDEHDGRRAKLARQLLDLLMRSDVPVVAGRDLGRRDNWAAESLVLPGVPDQSTDVIGAVDALLSASPEPVIWVGTGPMSNLADVLSALPAARELLIVQAGGSHSWFTDRPEPTIGADLPAARTILSAGIPMQLLPAEVTMGVLNVIDRDAIEYKVIARSDDPACIALRNHMDLWFDQHRGDFDQTALLTLAFAVDLSHFTVSPRAIELDQVGRIQPGEHVVMMADAVDYRAFNSWCIPRLANLENQHRAIPRPSLPPIRALTAVEILTADQGKHRAVEGNE